MLKTTLTCLVAMALLTGAWLGVQLAWRRVFPGECVDPDSLAGRLGCHGCNCNEDGSEEAEEAS